MPFDDRALAYLRDEQEVEIETIRPDGSPRRTIIWTLVDGTTSSFARGKATAGTGINQRRSLTHGWR